MSPARRSVLGVIGATLAGCAGRTTGGTGIDGGDPAGTPTDAASAASDGPATGSDGPATGSDGVPTADAVLHLAHDRAALRGAAQSGGPPKDGIPSVDEPSFEPADAVGGRLADGDVVFGVARDGVARAYPQAILAHHEIVNDRIAGDPVAVTYCPLTGTAMGFERGGTTFGVSGRLVNNNLIMYDRAAETWWPQVLATSVPGPWNPEPGPASLREFRVAWTTWRRWREAHPEAEVLTEDTGYARNYNRDPYGQYNPRRGYYRDDGTLFPPLAESDRFRPKDVVIGARTAAGATAFHKPALRESGTIEGTLAGDPVVAVHDPALDTGYVYRGTADGVSHAGDAVEVDGETHAPDSLPREHVLALDAMWFAWYGFYPDTSVHA